MGEDRASLGPLELTDGRWRVGDATRPGAHWVELRPEGLHQHEPDSEGQLVPWSRIMNGIRITWGKHPWNTNSRGLYTLRGMVATRDGGWLHMTLRHPYEDQQLRFDQHTRPYRAVDALRLEALLRQLTDEGRLQLLGDPEWVGRAAAHLVGGGNRWITSRALRRAVAEALAAAGPVSP
ncbi:hypothetical protein RKD37_005132 [Streptomyces ambofaciens]|uniref:hypothetical protein n=1 Tax=unclassified Streptomyces TaxID=2593676 RepID=UPI000F4C9453